MLDHHRVMTQDIYSYTVFGHSWITPEWGYGILLAESVRLIGPVAFWLLSAGLASLTVIVVAIRCRLLGAGWTWTGLLCVETGVAVTLSLDDRPQMVSYFFLGLLLLLMCPWPVSTGAGSTPFLPSSCCGPTSMAVSFWVSGVLALEVLAAAGGDPAGPGSGFPDPWPPGRRRHLGASAVATLVNPFGPRVYESALGVTFNLNGTIRQLIQEWQSPDFHNPPSWPW